MSRSQAFVPLALLLACALIALPFLADKFAVQFATRILIMSMFAMSLNLLVGLAGLVSLGHAAFFGIAGYCLALYAPADHAASFWASLPLALLAAGALALVIGALVVRTGGVYFIMATLAFAQMLYYLMHDSAIAGGSDGMYVYLRPDASVFGWRPFDLENYAHFYLLVLSLAAAVLAFTGALRASLFGRVLAGIRVNEPRMRSLGFAVTRYKLACFVVAGTLAGLSGYLATVQYGVVNPDMLGWQLSGAVLMMVILGGKDTLSGPLIGAGALLLLELGLQSLPEAGAVRLGKHWQLPLGIVIVLVALYLPGGIARRLRGGAAS